MITKIMKLKLILQIILPWSSLTLCSPTWVTQYSKRARVSFHEVAMYCIICALPCRYHLLNMHHICSPHLKQFDLKIKTTVSKCTIGARTDSHVSAVNFREYASDQGKDTKIDSEIENSLSFICAAEKYILT